MYSLAQLKYDLDFNKSMDDIIHVLKMSTSLQLRQLQRTRWSEQGFLQAFCDAFSLIKIEQLQQHQFIFRQQLSPKAVVVVTSDDGFLGDLILNLVDIGLAEKNAEDVLIVIGQKGANYLSSLKKSYLRMPGINEKTYVRDVRKLRKYLISQYLQGKINQAVIIYADFSSISSRDIKFDKLLPFPINDFWRRIKEVKRSGELLIESSLKAVVNEMVVLGLDFKLREIAYSSKLAEFSARIMHLENSYQELLKHNQKLSIDYFKILHNLSDQQLRESLSVRLSQERNIINS
ncbi:MAG: hypothetical protein DRP78_00985 [Candidatus Omnitrophota bacterium]|nr:MAG: hypothetical protein DRP78_00985 [Candidatus Omnitrophota bacterium]